MAYIPVTCEPFQAPSVLLGWLCCSCGHFNAKAKSSCYFCKHEICTVIELPALKRDHKSASKRILNEVVDEAVSKWDPERQRARAARAPKFYLTDKQKKVMVDKAVARRTG